MKTSFKSLLLSALVVSPVFAYDCTSFTYDQNRLLHKAYAVGSSHDYGYTLAAITWKESFVGKYIVKVNSNDKPYGSYGITHVKLDTAMQLLNEKSSWNAKAWIVPELINNDVFSLNLSILKLNSVKKKANGSWSKLWMMYNGNNPAYGQDIAKRVKTLKQCNFFAY